MAAEIERLWERGIDWLKTAGAEIATVSLPHTKYALPAYYIVAPAEASSNLARYDGVRYGLREPGTRRDLACMRTRASAGFGAEVKRRILIGTYVLSAGYYDAYYLKAQKVRTLIKRDFDEAFEEVRRDPDADDAVARLCARREVRRSGGDVPERHLHGDGEHGGAAGHVGAGGPVVGRDAARPAADRPRRSTRRPCSRAGAAIEKAAGPLRSPQDWWSRAA